MEASFHQKFYKSLQQIEIRTEASFNQVNISTNTNTNTWRHHSTKFYKSLLTGKQLPSSESSSLLWAFLAIITSPTALLRLITSVRISFSWRLKFWTWLLHSQFPSPAVVIRQRGFLPPIKFQIQPPDSFSRESHRQHFSLHFHLWAPLRNGGKELFF